MRKRHLKMILTLILVLMIIIGEIIIEYFPIQNVRKDLGNYILFDAKMIDKRHKGRFYEKSVVQYEFNGELRQAEVSYGMNDFRKGVIPIAIGKLDGEIVRMNLAFSLDEICAFFAILCGFVGEFILYNSDKKKLNIRKAKEMANTQEKFKNKKTAEINTNSGMDNCVELNKKSKYTKKINAIITKIKREIEVEYDYIWIWCESIETDGKKRKFKSNRVIETKRWHVGDIITVLLESDNEKNYEIVTDEIEKLSMD